MIGHKKIIDFFDNSLKRENTAHAYCFVGIRHLGKYTFALNLASRLLDIKEKDLSSSPDFYYLKRNIDEKKGEKTKDITVGQIRELKSGMQAGSWSGGSRVVIIDEAEKLSRAGSNALLKLLEEPGKGVHFFLITENEGEMLETIKSRCQKIYFSGVKGEELKIGLEKAGYNLSGKEEILEYALGRPGLAITLLENEEKYNILKIDVKNWQEIKDLPFYKKTIFVEKLADTVDKGDVENVLDLWIYLCRKQMLETSSNDKLKIVENIDAIAGAKRKLRQNVNAKLVLENVLLSI